MDIDTDHALMAETEGTMAEHATKKGKRVHLALPPLIHGMMKKAQEQTNAETLTEVTKAAFTVYLALLKEHKNGKEFIVRDRHGGKETTYAIFLNS